MIAQRFIQNRMADAQRLHARNARLRRGGRS